MSIDLVDREGDLGRVRLDPRLADVDGERVDEAVLLLDQHAAQLFELGTAAGDGAQHAGVEPAAHVLDNFGNGSTDVMSTS